jgi:CHAD domain-containing protein
MTSLIAERWGEVWKAVPVALAGEDPEGVHDVRVASRRLRAAMDVAVDCFPESWYRSLHRTAKEITGALGEVRDRDVLLEALQAESANAPAAERPGLHRLIDRVEREREVARAEMETFLNDLLGGDVSGEVVARFGPASAPSAAGDARGAASRAKTE